MAAKRSREHEEPDDADDEKALAMPVEQMLALLRAGRADLLPSSAVSAFIHIFGGFRARRKLAHVNSFADVCKLLRESQRVVIVSGAGISVSAGIPDFRGTNGLYRMVRERYNLPSPTCMFDMRYFRSNPQIFYEFARELWPGNHAPTDAHRFIALLERRNKLLINYSQNIDDLEHKAGITRVLQCHGSFATATCLSCRHRVNGSSIHEDVMARRIAYCSQCHPNGTPTAPMSNDEAGSSEEVAFVDRAYGVLKPDIVFFGEALSEVFRQSLSSDLPSADLLIVMGSSLKVMPVAGILQHLPERVPCILINKDVVARPHRFDVELLGYCDGVVQHLCRALDWKLEDLGDSRPSGEEAAADLAAEAFKVGPNRYCFEGGSVPSESSDNDGESPADDSDSDFTP